jgi:hypothetical protein
MQQGYDIDDVCRILASGTNIVKRAASSIIPRGSSPPRGNESKTRGRRGGTSIHSTGSSCSSPGFSTEALPIVLTSLQRRLDFLSIDEFADLTTRNSPELLFKVMGFGKPPTALNEQRLAHLRLHLASTARSRWMLRIRFVASTAWRGSAAIVWAALSAEGDEAIHQARLPRSRRTRDADGERSPESGRDGLENRPELRAFVFDERHEPGEGALVAGEHPLQQSIQ